MTKILTVSEADAKRLDDRIKETYDIATTEMGESPTEEQILNLGGNWAYNDAWAMIKETEVGGKTPVNDFGMKLLAVTGAVTVGIYVGKKLHVKDKAVKLYRKVKRNI